MNLGLEGKLVLVTAASAGLGFATALAVAAEGATVAICSRDQSRADAAAQRIRNETGATVHSFGADVSSESSLQSLFAKIETVMGGLDVLICNAGGPPTGGFSALSDDKWEHAFELTLMSVVRSVRHALPLMAGRDGGAILAMGSSSVKQPIPNLLLSNAFRPAVHGLCKTLAQELAPEGIRVNMLSPGRVLTERTQALDEDRAQRENKSVDEVRAATVATIPLGRLGRPAEFGNVAAFLVSDAASYLTGTSLIVDGGMVRAL